jgi:hypothetical protein
LYFRFQTKSLTANFDFSAAADDDSDFMAAACPAHGSDLPTEESVSPGNAWLLTSTTSRNTDTSLMAAAARID